MPHTFGALELPVQVPEETETAADPALDKIVAFLAAVMQARCAAAWDAVCPGQPVVKQTFTHDPEAHDFSSKWLPALYLWRGESTSERIADDYYVERSPLTLLWVIESTSQARQRLRASFWNAIAKSIRVAIEQGRDPAWVDAGDTEPSAPEFGSLILERASLWSIRLVRSQMASVTIVGDDGTAGRKYPALRCVVEIDEVETLTPDAAVGVAPTAGEIEITTADSPPEVVGEVHLIGGFSSGFSNGFEGGKPSGYSSGFSPGFY